MHVEATTGTTVVRAARPRSEYVDITGFGDAAPVYIEVWRGWRVECWSDWRWEEEA